MTFPTEKRINAELLLIRNRGFIYKMVSRKGSRNILTSLKRVTEISGKMKAQMRTSKAALHYLERQTNGSLFEKSRGC